MSFTVTLYSFSKRNNSTARPSGGQSFSCTIKQASGTVYPTILVDIGLGTAPAYNYAYIPAFSRYYWIVEHINRGPVWELKLKVDPLASWKNQIGNTNLYVTRSSAESDGNIYDAYYPALSSSQKVSHTGSTVWSGGGTATISGGTFICGVVSKSATVGSIKYCAMGSASFASMCAALLDDTIIETNGFTLDDASLALQKSLIDPLSFVKSCIWIPISGADIPGQSSLTLKVWDWDISPVAHTIVSMGTGYVVKSTEISLSDHPQVARGKYLNTSPYSVCTLNFPPFGMIDIDTTLIRDSAKIVCTVCVDVITGGGVLEVKNDAGVLLSRIDGKVGVEVSMAQVSRDYLGAAVSAGQAAGGLIGGLFSFDWGGAAQSAVSGIGSGTEAMIPRVKTIGGTGSFCSLYGTPAVYQQFFYIADEDNSHFGRGLCKIRKPSALGGFMMVSDGDVPAPATDAELEMIRGYLEGGFYYE